MSAISIFKHNACVSVDTMHGGKLEFVLTAAQNRRYFSGKGDINYSDMLHEAIINALKPTPARIEGIQLYGDITLSISAPTQEELDEALIIVEKTVKAWAAKYKIDKMKPV